MFAQLAERGIAWPTIDAAEMEDLMAYLGADPARDPAPRLQTGQVTLLRKGCLKCHSLRGEGAGLAPDLADSRAVADPPAAWTARMWRHTPTMATKARDLGILYPRFAAHEMTHLIGFLRNAAASP
jgi:mono/diheme cytochrome c family protein